MFRIIISLMLLGASCKTSEKQLKCLEEKIAENKKNDNYFEVKNALTDSLIEWADKGLKFTRIFHEGKWKVDEMVFNEKQNRVFGWILEIDDANSTLDYVDYFTGEKIGNEWHFYTQNIAGIWFDRKDNNGQPYTFDYLSTVVKTKVVAGGIINKSSCSINDKYINDWLDREGQYLRSEHEEFLKGK